ncbi:MAG: phage antirepressor N-terminal domain-containing protein [Bacteroidota bacterium]
MSQHELNLPQTLTFNDSEIPVPFEDSIPMVPVKHICKLLDLDYSKQNSWLKKDDFFAQLYELAPTVGADGKLRKMNCLPLVDVPAWISSIDNSNRSDEAIAKKNQFLFWLREQMMQYYKSMHELVQENEIELRLKKQIEHDEQIYSEINDDAKAVRDRINWNKRKLEEIRENRFNPQYRLDFEPRTELNDGEDR